MASPDVASLFTYIPLNKTINNVRVSDLHGKLSKTVLFKLLELATSEPLFWINYFINKLVEWQGFSSGSHPCNCISMQLRKRVVG